MIFTKRLRPCLDAVFWGCFLIMLAWVAFIPGGFLGGYWLTFNTVFYAYLACLILHLSCGGRANLRALHAATPPVVLLALSIVWLLVQAYLPIANGFYSSVFTGASEILWFNPELRLSIVPEKTRALMLSSIFDLLLFVLTLLLLDTRQRLKQLLFVFVLIGAVHAGLGILAKYSNLFLVDKAQLDGHFDAARGLFINRNHFASFIILCLVGTFTFLLRHLMRERNFSLSSLFFKQFLSLNSVFLTVLFLSMVAILLSQSRGGFGGLLITLLAIAVYYGRGKRGVFGSKRILLPVALIFFSSVGYFGEDLYARFVNEGFSVGERFIQWKITWWAIVEQPLIGYGGGSYETVFQIFRGYQELRHVLFDQSHNLYLHVLLEQGVIGLVLLGGFLLLVIRSANASLSKTKSTLIYSCVLACMVVLGAALIQSMFDFNLQIINIRSYFFVIIAIVFAAPRVRRLPLQ